MRAWLGLVPWLALCVAAGASCGGGSPTNPNSSGAGSGTSSGAGGSGGGTGTNSGAAGVTSGGAGGSGGTAGSGATSSGASSGAGTTGATGTASGSAGASGGAAGASGGAGASGASSGASGTGSGASATGASGSGGTSGTGDGGTVLPFVTGTSPGCGIPPSGGDNSGGYTQHSLPVKACPGTVCSTDPLPRDCVSPCFAPGGPLAVSSGPYDFTHRNYALRLPQNYQLQTAYPLVLEGGGCAGGNTESGGGFSVGQPATAAIVVGMSYVSSPQNGACFADGGLACASNPPAMGGPPTGGAPSLPLCVNNPEMAYINAVIADVGSKYCVDRTKVFMGGYSSGAWISQTMGCALADKIRGIATADGGLRQHRPTCVGPEAALLVAGEADTVNPIGPLPPAQVTPYTDSAGSAPERDDILARNGCLGSATTMYDPAYPTCVTYTGCPAAFPVVWCPLPGVGHVNPGVAGSPPPAFYWNFLSKLPAHP
jgi:hypothetical protein